MPTIDVQGFGQTRAGHAISRFILTSESGVTLQCISYGAAITALTVPGRDGTPGDIVLGFDTLEAYERQAGYLGAVIGRYANRLANGRFALDGTWYQVARNEGDHHLHGGLRGFDKQVWAGEPVRRADQVGVRFTRCSPAGEEGYPGRLDVEVTYLLGVTPEVTIEFRAMTTAATIVNLTQHAYFNLSAGAVDTIGGHELTIRGSAVLEVDTNLIPTGRLLAVEGTAFDFRSPHIVGARIDDPSPQLQYGLGYDHTWALDDSVADGPPAASLYEPRSGRRLDIRTTEPGLQFYAGNRLNVVGKSGRRYGPRSGLCLETQHFPNSTAHPHFPSTVLRPGQEFRSATTWAFGWS